jgi:diguanylate cyclase (GGDEF)-like protein/PAS domain S-box-containing protein
MSFEAEVTVTESERKDVSGVVPGQEGGALDALDYPDSTAEETPAHIVARLQKENARLLQRIAQQDHDLQHHETENASMRAIEETGIGVWHWDLEIQHIYRSPQIYQIIGFTVEDIPGTLDECVHPDDQALCQEQLEDFIEGHQEKYSVEFRLRHRDGSWRWVLSRATALRGPDGRAERIFGTIVDITDQKNTASAYRRSEERFRAISEASPIGIFVNDVAGNCCYVNPAYIRITGVPEEDALGRGWRQFIHPDDRERLLEEWRAAMQRFYEGEPFVFDTIRRNVKPDGEIRWVHLNVAAMYDTEGFCNGYVGTLEDVTDYRLAEDTLRRSEVRFSTLISHFPVGVVMVDENQRVVLMNQELCRLFRLPASPIAYIGRSGEETARDLVPFVSEGVILLDHLQQQTMSRETVTGELLPLNDGRIIERDSLPILRGSEYMGHLWLHRDVTERVRQEREKAQKFSEVQERADRDALTALHNYGAFHRELFRTMEKARERQETFAVALLDADNFKFFNDEYGHASGDQVLKQIAQGLRNASRPTDCIGRVGGDEFAIILPRMSVEQTAEVTFRLKNMPSLHGYRPSEGMPDVPICLSMGIAFYPQDGDNVMELLRVADARLYQDKRESQRQGAAVYLAETVRARITGEVAGFAMLDALVMAVDNKDRYTRRHSEEVLFYSSMIGQEMGLSETELSTLTMAALIHDVGKIGVPDRVLRLPGELDGEEFEAVKQHAVLGAAIVSAVKGMESTLGAVRHHHERWDGRGYPDGLKGEEIPSAARIMAVADSFAAMTRDRPYRKRLTDVEAMKKLWEGAGTQWSAKIIAVFDRAYKKQI